MPNQVATRDQDICQKNKPIQELSDELTECKAAQAADLENAKAKATVDNTDAQILSINVRVRELTIQNIRKQLEAKPKDIKSRNKGIGQQNKHREFDQ